MPPRNERSLNQQSKAEFRERPRLSDFVYYYTTPANNDDEMHLKSKIIYPAFAEVAKRYGVRMNNLVWGRIPPISDKIPYILAGPLNPLALPEADRDYLTRLAKFPNARVNLLPAFPYNMFGDSDDYRARAESEIPELDRLLKVNTIFPDDTDALYRGLRTVTARVVADNIVCETFRLKYDPKRDDSPATQQILAEKQVVHKDEIDTLRKIYKGYHLWHRSETDGAIAIAAGDGYIVSQTKTNKALMTENDFSLVTGYSPEQNSLTFAGNKVPTSDAPELLVVLDVLKKHRLPFKFVIHFHQNDITRGGQFPDSTSGDVIEYGRFESGKTILRLFKKRISTNWMILRDHGVLWFGNSPEEFEEFVKETLGLTKINS